MLHSDLRESILEALRVGMALDIHLVQVDLVAIVRLAIDCEFTTYDASYLHVARSLGLPLVTFDERLRAASAR